MQVTVDIPYKLGDIIQVTYINGSYKGVIEFHNWCFVIRILEGNYYFIDYTYAGSKYAYLKSLIGSGNVELIGTVID